MRRRDISCYRQHHCGNSSTLSFKGWLWRGTRMRPDKHNSITAPQGIPPRQSSLSSTCANDPSHSPGDQGHHHPYQQISHTARVAQAFPLPLPSGSGMDRTDATLPVSPRQSSKLVPRQPGSRPDTRSSSTYRPETKAPNLLGP